MCYIMGFQSATQPHPLGQDTPVMSISSHHWAAVGVGAVALVAQWHVRRGKAADSLLVG